MAEHVSDGRVYQTNYAPKPEPITSRGVSKKTLLSHTYGYALVIELFKPGKYKRYISVPDEPEDRAIVQGIIDQLGDVEMTRISAQRTNIGDIHYFFPDEQAYALFDLISYFGD